jgi:3-oxoacyl-[acyl-carrier protein] reductase
VNRSVLVTGGNRGIGLAVARRLAEDGEQTAITYRTGDPPDGLYAVPCDVRDAKAVESALERVAIRQGPVEVLVANAGITRDGLALMLDEQDYRDVFETNLMGTIRWIKAVAPEMVRARSGRIILLSSVVGLMGAAGQTNYAASKAALVGLARSLAWELGARGITVNVVAPGYIETDMTSGLTDKRKQQLTTLIPMRRTGTVDEVAAVVGFLASPEASYVTGAFVPVAGGMGMGN